MGEEPVINSVDVRKVANGFVVRVVRQAPHSPTMAGEECVFTSWNDLVSFLSTEGFI